MLNEEIKQSREKIMDLNVDMRKQLRTDHPNWSVVEEYASEISSLADHIRYLETLRSKYSEYVNT